MPSKSRKESISRRASRPAERAVAAAIGIVLALAPALAAADEPYLEPEGFHPQGFTIGVSLLGGGFASTSCCPIGGNNIAGAASLRWGVVATPRVIELLELDGASALVRNRSGEGRGELDTNTYGAVSLGAQYYLEQVLWVRGGVGFAGYSIRRESDEVAEGNLQRSGIALRGGAGFDFLQRRDVWFFGLPRQDFAVSFEVLLLGSVYPPRGQVMRDGALVETALEPGAIMQISAGFGVQWY